MKKSFFPLYISFFILTFISFLFLSIGKVKAISVSVENTTYTLHAMNPTGWVTPLSHFGADTYFAYIDENRTAHVGKRNASGVYSHSPLVTGVTNDPGHNEFSIAVDGDGFIHVWGNMHNNTMRYWRSNQPQDISSFTALGSEFPNGKYTYPQAATAPNGDVYLAIRNLDNGRPCELFHWNDSGNNWSKVAAFGQQSGYTCYIPRPWVDDVGNVHIVWHWREGSPGPNRHLVCYVMYDPDTGLFYNANGTQAIIPITTTSCDQAQPLEPGESWSEQGTTSMYVAVDDNYRPVISYRYAVDGTTSGVYEFRLAYWSGTQWVRSTISTDGNNTSRSAMVYTDGTIYNYMVPASDRYLYQYRSSDGINWTSTLITTEINVTSFVASSRDDSTHILYFSDDQPSDLVLKFVVVDNDVSPSPTATPSSTSLPTNTPIITNTPLPTATASQTPLPTATTIPGSAALFVVANANSMNASDIAIRNRLIGLGYSVIVVSDELTQSSDANGKSLIVVSATVSSGDLNTKFRNSSVPALMLEPALFDDMGMTGPTDTIDYGSVENQTSIEILNSSHLLAAGLSGTVQVVGATMRMNWGLPNANAVSIASITGSPSQRAIFAYESGTSMLGLTAPARRVGFFMFNDAAVSLTSNGGSLLDAAINWLVDGVSANTPTPNPTSTFSPSPTATLTPLPTNTSTPLPTNTLIVTNTNAPTASPTFTPLPTNTPVAGSSALFIVADANSMNASDIAIRDRLIGLGYGVIVVSDELTQSSDANGKSLIVVSATVSSGDVNTKFRDLSVPVLMLEPALFDDMGMTGATDGVDYGSTQNQNSITILNVSHPLAAGLSGTIQVVTQSMRMNWGVPNANAVSIASIDGNTSQSSIFAYETGIGMMGLTAPARRVGSFMFNDAAASLTGSGWSLFDVSVNWLAGNMMMNVTNGSGERNITIEATPISEEAGHVPVSGNTAPIQIPPPVIVTPIQIPPPINAMPIVTVTP
ncbi:MAG: BNR-4 repeat-containing protein [Aggregatilineales bacterium]